MIVPATPFTLRFPSSCLALGAAALALTLAGCVTVPAVPLHGEVPAQWQQAARGSAPAPDLHSWWKAFGDADLDRLVDRALADNLGLAQARARVLAARQLTAASGLQHLPQLGFHTYAEPTPDSSASYFQFGFDAKWELDWFGRGLSNERVARGEQDDAQAQAQAARVSVVAEVVRAYLDLRAAQQRLVLLDTLAAAARRRVELTTTRARLRMAEPGELARAQAQQAGALAALSEPRTAIARSQYQLAALLGHAEPATLELAAGNLPPLGEQAIASTPADLLRTRPDIRRAEAAVLKAAGELGIARADSLPHLGLGGALTYAARVIGHTRLSDAAGIVTLGPAIDIPLFDWGRRQHVAAAHEAQLDASVYAYRQAVIDGVAEAETALATLAQQRQREIALQQAIAPLAAEVQAATTRQRLGLGDGFARLEAESALAQAQLDVLAARLDRGTAFVALYKALGGAPLPAEAEH